MKGVKFQLLVVLAIFVFCILEVTNAVTKCSKTKKCPGSQCCSNKGKCINPKTCGKSCQKSLGKCVQTKPSLPPPSTPPPATSPPQQVPNTLIASKDGKCGKEAGTRCADGVCCSKFNFCGVTTEHCQDGCQSSFGTCGTPGAPATTTPPKQTTDTSLPLSKDGKCGKEAGTRCADGVCCSKFNFCGVTTDHCQQECQPLFGTCGTPGAPTIDNSGFQFDTCTEKNTIALTFDDGPRNFTNKLLDDLKAKNVKATFFMNGHGFPEDCIYDYAPVIQRAFKEGHQIASHTWSHPHLPEVSESEIIYQLEQLEKAFKKIIGAVPTYFRPPFGEHNEKVDKIVKERGYKLILWDIDTLDWQENLQASIKTYDDEIKKSPQPNPHIVLNHDRIETTSTTLGPYEAKDALNRGYKVTTVGDCIGQPNKNDWYRDIGEPSKRDSTWKCTLEDMHN